MVLEDYSDPPSSGHAVNRWSFCALPRDLFAAGLVISDRRAEKIPVLRSSAGGNLAHISVISETPELELDKFGPPFLLLFCQPLN
jgi:hypothetical protein